MNDPTLGAGCVPYACIFIDVGGTQMNGGLDEARSTMRVYSARRPYDQLKFTCTLCKKSMWGADGERSEGC